MQSRILGESLCVAVAGYRVRFSFFVLIRRAQYNPGGVRAPLLAFLLQEGGALPLDRSYPSHVTVNSESRFENQKATRTFAPQVAPHRKDSSHPTRNSIAAHFYPGRIVPGDLCGDTPPGSSFWKTTLPAAVLRCVDGGGRFQGQCIGACA